MVGVVQLAEHWIVVPGVVGSSPITHPRITGDIFGYLLFLYWNGTPKGDTGNALRCKTVDKKTKVGYNDKKIFTLGTS